MHAAIGVTELRCERGMTVARLAQLAEMSRVTVYAVERGEPVSMDTLIRVATALEVPLSTIAPDAADRVAEVA